MKISFRSLAIVALLMTPALFAADEKIKLEGAKCPVAGTKPAKDGTEVEYKGAKVYFCCMNCPKAFKADTAKFAVKANQQLVVTTQAKQIKCPLTGGKINPDTKIDVQGAEVAFCCNMCKGKVSDAKGAEQLELVFSDKAFEKGFEIPKKEEKK